MRHERERERGSGLDWITLILMALVLLLFVLNGGDGNEVISGGMIVK
uniref:Uncharacterized protein n=1 Tax=viral metagenome TaxID=1070528 RepID=A0A6M3JH68_9ZZZZ